MNLVERFFGELTPFIGEKSFASTRELADAIITFLTARNDNPRRYVWKAKGEDILRKIDAARRGLNTQRNPISDTPPASARFGLRASAFGRRYWALSLKAI
jgi:hypothetical protein